MTQHQHALALAAWTVMCLSVTVPAHSASTASFDDLPNLPLAVSQDGLFFANNNSANYAGVVWDSRFQVVGGAYRVDTSTPGPLYGIAHSGNYFVTNQGDGNSSDGLMIATSKVLTGAWFGRNAYYGFGVNGADQVTVNAMNGALVLASIVFDLPITNAGEPESLGHLDTSAFWALSGITGYRIDRHAPGEFQSNWVADDFTFADQTVAEPATAWLLAGGVLALLLRRRDRLNQATDWRRPV